jgi:hypothetical protein
LCGYELEIHQQVGKLFRHEILKLLLPSFMSNLGEIEQSHLIMESIKTRVSTHLVNGRTTKHFAAREFISTLSSTRLASGRIVAKNLRLDRHCIYYSLQHRSLIDDGAIDFWSRTQRHKWCTVIST